MRPGTEWSELGRDALDLRSGSRAVRWPWLPRRRLTLGVGSTPAPTLIFVLCGMALGPLGIGVLTPSILNRLDLVVSVALAIIGVYVGIGMTNIPKDSAGAALIGGTVTSAVTVATVTGGLFLLVTSWNLPLPTEAIVFAVIVGICSSASAAVNLDANVPVRRAASIADADDVPLLMLGAIAIAVLAGHGSGSVAVRILLTAAGGAAIGVAGWLLFDRADGAAERGVFVTGAVLLIAGIGAYLGTSPLLSGLVAAVVWVHAPGEADRITADDLRLLQHPLLALLLIFAGTLIDATPMVLWAAPAVVVLRLMGKLLASIAGARLARVPPALLATVLLPPGVIGIALALNVRQVLGGDDAGIVGVVTAAACASELAAAFLPLDHVDVP